jgi:16S rRNA (adenine1518-N6/adenine1519-N6)-dimethyltransferase
MRLLAAHGLRPDTDLGQHFLLDENLVDLAVRQAGVGAGDVALEVGAGLGVLTVALGRAAATVHAVELDRRLAPALEEAVAGRGDIRIHWGDAMRMDLGALAPAPTVLVSNLPYSIATPLVLESLWGLPSVDRWCVMAQREVVDRWLAPPGGGLYGGPSVLLQLATEATFRRAVGREVFAPRPRVDSALVALRRTGPGPAPAVRAIVRAAFSARRKTLVNSLAGAGAERPRVVAALAALGLAADVRPQVVPPPAYAALAGELEWTA